MFFLSCGKEGRLDDVGPDGSKRSGNGIGFWKVFGVLGDGDEPLCAWEVFGCDDVGPFALVGGEGFHGGAQVLQERRAGIAHGRQADEADQIRDASREV